MCDCADDAMCSDGAYLDQVFQTLALKGLLNILANDIRVVHINLGHKDTPADLLCMPGVPYQHRG